MKNGKSYSISLKHLNENDLKDLQYCICLNGKDDKVQIVWLSSIIILEMLGN